jgi:hypothetical protein
MSTAQWSDLSSVVIASIEQAIQEADEELSAVSLDIHGHPELGWDEHHAHEVLSTLMEKEGFEVERHAYGMKTAWRASYEVGQGGRTIGFNSESKPYSGAIPFRLLTSYPLNFQWTPFPVSAMRAGTTSSPYPVVQLLSASQPL